MRPIILAGLLMTLPLAGQAQNITFGNNGSEWARDGVCDDPRFAGPGMAQSLDEDDRGKDAADCRNAFRDGRVKLWVQSEAQAATQCSAIRFGNNSSEWARDGECDDYRFIGKGMSSVLLSEDIGRDARDCKALCNAGLIFVRDY